MTFAGMVHRCKRWLRGLVSATRYLLRGRHRSTLTEQAVFELVAGKSVALVGNARSLASGCAGPAIDDHDIVIRCNAAPMPSVESHGRKTTVIATSIPFDEALMAQRGADVLFWMTPRRERLPRWMERWPRFFLYPTAHHRGLMRRVSQRPTTGLMVIELLSRSGCRSVVLYGFDFYRSFSLSSPGRYDGHPHDYVAEESEIRRLLRQDRRFSIVE